MSEKTIDATEVPTFDRFEFFDKRSKYCWCVVTLNEGENLLSQLNRMKSFSHLADIIVGDGYSDDGSTDITELKSFGIRAVLKTHQIGLSTATRMVLAYAIEQGYSGVITIDGNGKDGVEAIPNFIQELENGCDLVQGSRFLKGGRHQHTPLERLIGIRLILPLIFFASCGFWYTDGTNAFRALSMKFIKDPRVKPLRKNFIKFNLQFYFIYRAAKLGFNIKEIPVVRVYKNDGSKQSKIIGWKLKLTVLKEMLLTAIGKYNPKNQSS